MRCRMCLRSTTRRSRRLRSSEPSGSSSISRRGCGASERANATLCCSPPESVFTSRFSKSGKPTNSSVSLILCSISARDWSRVCKPKAIFLATFKWGKRAKSWNMRPKPRWCTGTSARGLPSHSTSPSSGGNSPAIIPNRVDFPQPLGPSKARISPRCTLNETPCRAALLSKDL